MNLHREELESMPPADRSRIRAWVWLLCVAAATVLLAIVPFALTRNPAWFTFVAAVAIVGVVVAWVAHRAKR